MSSQYVAVKDKYVDNHLMTLERMGIKYKLFAHDDIWCVVRMYGFNGTNGYNRTYDLALKAVGVIVE
jgi:hypothetical protein